jgi:ethanolamine permease
MASLFRLRATEPALERPFRAPFYPVFPAVALGLALLALATMIYFNALVFGLFVALMATAWLFYRFTADMRANGETDPLLNLAQVEARTMTD